jgi:hypothetical protein
VQGMGQLFGWGTGTVSDRQRKVVLGREAAGFLCMVESYRKEAGQDNIRI